MARNSIPIDPYRLRKAESMSTRHAYCKVCALSGKTSMKRKTREGEECMKRQGEGRQGKEKSG